MPSHPDPDSPIPYVLTPKGLEAIGVGIPVRRTGWTELDNVGFPGVFVRDGEVLGALTSLRAMAGRIVEWKAKGDPEKKGAAIQTARLGRAKF